MKYELSDKYNFFNNDATAVEKKIKSAKYGSLIRKTVYALFENGLIQTYYLDAEDKILFSYSPDKTRKEAVGEVEEINRNEIEYSGYGYHGGGRKPTGVKRVSICISGQPEQIARLKELAAEENMTVSGFIFEKCGVNMNAREFNRNHAIENGKNPEVYWGMQDYFLYAMKDGYIMSYTTGSNRTVGEEIKSKGRNDFDFWLVEKDNEISFLRYDGEKVSFEKKIAGKIVEDRQIDSSVFGSMGGGLVTKFMNYRIEN